MIRDRRFRETRAAWLPLMLAIGSDDSVLEPHETTIELDCYRQWQHLLMYPVLLRIGMHSQGGADVRVRLENQGMWAEVRTTALPGIYVRDYSLRMLHEGWGSWVPARDLKLTVTRPKSIGVDVQLRYLLNPPERETNLAPSVRFVDLVEFAQQQP